MGRLTRALFYSGPLLAWLALIFFLSTSAGASGVSGSLAEAFVRRLAPDLHASLTPYQLDWLNYLVRKGAHLTEYFVLLLLAVRALQHGLPHLRWSTFLGAVAIGMAWACADEYHQSFVSTRTALFDDVLLDWVGCAAAAALILLFFSEKAVERRLKRAWDTEREDAERQRAGWQADAEYED